MWRGERNPASRTMCAKYWSWAKGRVRRPVCEQLLKHRAIRNSGTSHQPHHQVGIRCLRALDEAGHGVERTALVGIELGQQLVREREVGIELERAWRGFGFLGAVGQGSAGRYFDAGVVDASQAPACGA